MAKHTIRPTTQTINRLRSSSRCSTRLSRSSWPIGLMLMPAAPVRGRARGPGSRPPARRRLVPLARRGPRHVRLRRERVSGLGAHELGATPGCRRVVVLVVARLAGDRVLELAHAAAELLAEAGKPLGTEDHQNDDQDDDELEGTDVGHLRMAFRSGLRSLAPYGSSEALTGIGPVSAPTSSPSPDRSMKGESSRPRETT